MATKKTERILLVVLLLAAVFLPEVVSAGWHLVFGMSVDYRYWKVSVPFEWYAVSRGEGMSVERMLHLPWKEGPVAVFEPVHFTRTYVFNYELYGKEQQRTLEGRGYALTGQRDLTIAGQDARCWAFQSAISGRELDTWIACVVPKDLTSIDFIGTKAYSEGFYQLLAKIKRAPASK